MSSPRPWGCFQFINVAPGDGMVFPTPVGVFLFARIAVWHLLWSSPRPWGCFLDEDQAKLFAAVFPTPVGVFLLRVTHASTRQSLPHARGGVSI